MPRIGWLPTGKDAPPGTATTRIAESEQINRPWASVEGGGGVVVVGVVLVGVVFAVVVRAVVAGAEAVVLFAVDGDDAVELVPRVLVCDAVVGEVAVRDPVALAAVDVAADVVEAARLDDVPAAEDEDPDIAADVDEVAAVVVAPVVSAEPLEVARTPVMEPELEVSEALAAGSTPEPLALRATNHTTPMTTSSARTATVTRRTQYTPGLWGPTGCITRSR
jgi:hypothetical protein